MRDIMSCCPKATNWRHPMASEAGKGARPAPTSQQYRDNWDAIFGPKCDTCEHLETCLGAKLRGTQYEPSARYYWACSPYPDLKLPNPLYIPDTCPWCGDQLLTEFLMAPVKERDQKPTEWWVTCDRCEMCGPAANSREDAVLVFRSAFGGT